MPWHIEEGADGCPAEKPFAVIKDADGSVAGCHADEASARDQVAALYANEGGKGEAVFLKASADEQRAWLNGEIPRRLLAYPFTGPLPGGAKGLDMDAEYFDEATDIKPDWFPQRPLLWTHGLYPRMGADLTVIGKATNLGTAEGPSDEPDEDGWWVDVWLKAGEARARQIERLVARGGKLFGSVGTMPHMIRRGKAGHIDCWPYFEQSLTTSPQNTHSAFRSAKALLGAYDDAEITVDRTIRDLLTEFEESIAHLRTNLPTGGEGAAKAGRELSGSNMGELDEWYEALSSVLSRIDAIRGRVRDRYKPKEAGTGIPREVGSAVA